MKQIDKSAHYDTLKYINSFGDFQLNMMYRDADDPKAAWDKIYDIQDVWNDTKSLIRDFV